MIFPHGKYIDIRHLFSGSGGKKSPEISRTPNSPTETCQKPSQSRFGDTIDNIPCVGGCLGLLADFVETHLGCHAWPARKLAD